MRLIDADDAARYLVSRFGVWGQPTLEQVIDALADYTDGNEIDFESKKVEVENKKQ
jgi:hypothetical protein